MTWIRPSATRLKPLLLQLFHWLRGDTGRPSEAIRPWPAPGVHGTRARAVFSCTAGGATAPSIPDVRRGTGGATPSRNGRPVDHGAGVPLTRPQADALRRLFAVYFQGMFDRGAGPGAVGAEGRPADARGARAAGAARPGVCARAYSDIRAHVELYRISICDTTYTNYFSPVLSSRSELASPNKPY